MANTKLDKFVGWLTAKIWRQVLIFFLFGIGLGIVCGQIAWAVIKHVYHFQ